MSDKSSDAKTAVEIVNTLKTLTEVEAGKLFRGELEDRYPHWRDMIRAFWGISSDNLKKRGTSSDFHWAEETFIKNYSKLTFDFAYANLQAEDASRFLAVNLPDGFIRLVDSSPSVLAEILTDHLGWGMYIRNQIRGGGFMWSSETIEPLWPIVLVEALKILNEDEDLLLKREETEKDETNFLEIFTYASKRGEYKTKDLWPKMELDNLDLDTMLGKMLPLTYPKEKDNDSP
jgi:hypothetical protein